MIKLNRVQKQPICATTMEYNLESNDPVQQIISLLQTNPDPQVMLTEIAITIGQSFQADICLIVTESHSGLIPQIGFWKRKKSTPETTKQWLLDHLLKTLMTEGELIAIADLENDSFLSGSKQLLEHLPIKALLGMATQFGQNANGFILLGTHQTHAWTQPEQTLFKRLGQVVALANSMIYQKAEVPDNLNQSMSPFGTTRSIPGDNLIKKWYQLTRQQLEQQRHLNELKDEIITTISHETGTPLSSMKMAIEILGNPNNNLSSESQKKYLNILKQEWQRLYDLIENIKTLQKLRSAALSVQRQRVDLRPLFNELVQLFQEQWQEDKRKRLTLATEGLLSSDDKTAADSSLTLYTDPQHLRSILVELLTNAGKFSDIGTTVSVEITEQQQGKQKNFVITITNIGMGITPEEQQYIFEPFRRGKGMTDKAIPGTGLGLTLVKGLVELLGGRIEVASHLMEQKNSDATSFILTLPQA